MGVQACEGARRAGRAEGLERARLRYARMGRRSGSRQLGDAGPQVPAVREPDRRNERTLREELPLELPLGGAAPTTWRSGM